MSNTQTTASFVGGIEGVNVAGAISTTALVGVGTTYAAGTTPVLSGGINFCSTTVGNTALALPASWPLSAPIIVSNTTGAAASAIVVTPTGASLNGAANGTLTVAAGKTAIFYCLGLVNGLGLWVSVLSA